MAFRTIIINSHSKIEYSLNYLVYKTIDETKRILLDDIHTVIFESTNISITTSILCELIKHKIKVIFCDEKHNPLSELVAYNGCHNSTKRILTQINWTSKNKDNIWRDIIIHKINNQANLLLKVHKNNEAKQLYDYALEVVSGDLTNREGHAAKVYFNNVFFPGFTRSLDSLTNNYLDYGYTILLSQFNRAITAYGCILQIGIHHKGEFNPFNLSCDLVESVRFLVDEIAISINEKDDFKDVVINKLNENVTIGGESQTLSNAIQIYVDSVLSALDNGDISKIMYITKNE